MNEDHTCEDLILFCAQFCTGSAEVRAGFPPKILEPSLTNLKDAGLLNSSVTIRSI